MKLLRGAYNLDAASCFPLVPFHDSGYFYENNFSGSGTLPEFPNCDLILHIITLKTLEYKFLLSFLSNCYIVQFCLVP